MNMILADNKVNSEVIIELHSMLNNEKYDEIDNLFSSNFVDHIPGKDVNGNVELKKTTREFRKKYQMKNKIKDLESKTQQEQTLLDTEKLDRDSLLKKIKKTFFGFGPRDAFNGRENSQVFSSR